MSIIEKLEALRASMHEDNYDSFLGKERECELIDEIIEQAKAEQERTSEPFGYFKAEPFGWTDCADDDEGAIALYEKPQPTPQDVIEKRNAELEVAVKESNDRLYEEREMWDRMFGDGAKKLELLELELDDCLYVLGELWDKQCNKIVTQKWAEILIRNKRVTGASSAEDSCLPKTE